MAVHFYKKEHLSQWHGQALLDILKLTDFDIKDISIHSKNII